MRVRVGVIGVAAVALLVVLGAQGGVKAPPFPGNPKQDQDIPSIIRTDPRIEYVARAICRAHGLDPDHAAYPYPGPLWWRFVLVARDILAADDAQDAWVKRRPGRKGPPNE